MSTQTVSLTKDQMLGFYRQMLLIRRVEEALAKLYQSGMIYGACHTYVGEEAVGVGVCANLTNADSVFSTHRGHGHALAKGIPPREVIAELLGRSTGCSSGRGGSMHLYKPEIGHYGSSGIVGPSILLATGAAYTYKLTKTQRLAVAFFGDGASNNGAFYEGMNLGTAFNLPVVYVCENNLYATEISLKSVSHNPEIATRAAALGLPGVAVDGNDVLAVYRAAQEAVERARSGNGPTLLECKTYRTRAHSEGMRDTGYRTQEEVNEWKERDPIKRWKAHLLEDKTATPDELETVEKAVEDEVEAAVDFAKGSPYPDPATVASFLFSE